MGEEITFEINDTYREIGSVLTRLEQFESPLLNRSTKNQIIAKLQEAQFWSLHLIRG